MAKTRKIITLRPEFAEELQALAKAEGVGMGVIVERGLDKLREAKND